MTTEEVVIKLALAGFGRPSEIWRWPLHYYRAVTREYFRSMRLAAEALKRDDGMESVKIADNVWIERPKQR